MEYSNEEELEASIVVVDPLAELACELALCCEAVEQNKGGFCDDCTCLLTYHLPVEEEDGECELCGCYMQHKKPWPILVPSASIPKYVNHYSRPSSVYEDAVGRKERDKAARKVLRELTE